mgnify:CR=1 FL=1
MIISLHTPKAGGTSFKMLLENHYKKGFKSDYIDIPINKPLKDRLEDIDLFKSKMTFIKRRIFKYRFKCVHGHFLISKYSAFIDNKDVKYITWLRDPLERLISHYYYWQRAYNSETSAPLHLKVIEEGWTLEEFCLSKEMQNMYSQFLLDFPIERFDFIGIMEYFDDDVKFFSESFLKTTINEIPHLNVRAKKENEYIKDESLINKIRQFHQKDYQLYNFALQKRLNRIENQERLFDTF